jgi:hypothetical protein
LSILLPTRTAGPTLIASTSLRARRFGPASGGWLIGLLLRSGPIALLLALDHCATLTSRLARGLTAGDSARAALKLGYVALARRGWRSSTGLVVGTATFLVTAASPASVGPTVPLLRGCALATLLVGLRLVPARAVAPTPPHTRRDAAVAVYRELLVGLFGLRGFATRFAGCFPPSIQLDQLWTSQRATVQPA